MRYVLLLLALLAVLSVKAQEGGSTMYFLSNLPQRVRVNPAYQPEYNVQVGLPGLSGIQFSYANTSFGVDDILTKKNFGRTDSVVLNINSFHGALRKNNAIIGSNENSLLTVGFRVSDWYATIDLTQKNDFSFNFSKDLITFIKDGNTDYLGKTFDLGGFGVNENSYVEMAFGLSNQVNSKLTVGGRFKVLFGLLNVDMTDSEMGIETVGQGETIRLRSRQNIRFSAPIEPLPAGQFVDWGDLEFNSDITPRTFTNNLGFGVDLGAEYKMLDRLTLHASLLDLGFIRWKSNTHVFTQDKTFDWEGADLSNSINKDQPGYISMDDAFDNLVDSLKDNFRFMDNAGAYTTMLKARLYAGATYELHRMVNVGGLLKMSIIDKHFYPSLALSVNARLIRNISASVSYSMQKGSCDNLGAGLTAKLGPFQLYAVTDNLLALRYTSTRSVNARFGLNLLFGGSRGVWQTRTKNRNYNQENKVQTEHIAL